MSAVWCQQSVVSSLVSAVWCQRSGGSSLMSAICCYLRRRNLCAIFIVAEYVELNLLPNTCSTILTIEASWKPVVMTHWLGHWVLATGPQPPSSSHPSLTSSPSSSYWDFRPSYSSIFWVEVSVHVNWGLKVPTPRVLKQPLNLHTS
jgi:hypothetical protein